LRTLDRAHLGRPVGGSPSHQPRIGGSPSHQPRIGGSPSHQPRIGASQDLPGPPRISQDLPGSPRISQDRCLPPSSCCTLGPTSLFFGIICGKKRPKRQDYSCPYLGQGHQLTRAPAHQPGARVSACNLMQSPNRMRRQNAPSECGAVSVKLRMDCAGVSECQCDAMSHWQRNRNGHDVTR